MAVTRIPEYPKPPSGAGGGPYDNVIIARMSGQADLAKDSLLPRGPERRTAVYNDLVAAATASQGATLAKLADLKTQGLVTSYESMFMPNAIVIHAASGKAGAVESALQGLANLQGVQENHTWGHPSAAPEQAAAGAVQVAANAATGVSSGTPEWGVAKIGAPAAWAKGYTGQGVTIGIVDTGLDATHPAIKAHYRGTNADGTQTNDYNWFDAAAGKPVPYDDGDHGTHVAGTAAGGTDGHVIGVAPGAKIIAAKAILGSGYNTTEATLRALQFMLAPTDVNGNNPKPALGADIVSNSWGNADLSDPTFLETWADMKAAGTIMVTAAGNDGPGGKVSPPGSYVDGISVGATTSSDHVAYFSSRGPSKFDPSKQFPTISAPGQGVTSSVPGGYASYDGTSMATPHVSGAVALMLSAKPDATYDQIVAALENTATDIDVKGPDNAAGYGRINVDKAIDYLLKGGSAAAPSAAAAPAHPKLVGPVLPAR
jgi:subtilisin family serine protease